MFGAYGFRTFKVYFAISVCLAGVHNNSRRFEFKSNATSSSKLDYLRPLPPVFTPQIFNIFKKIKICKPLHVGFSIATSRFMQALAFVALTLQVPPTQSDSKIIHKDSWNFANPVHKWIYVFRGTLLIKIFNQGRKYT